MKKIVIAGIVLVLIAAGVVYGTRGSGGRGGEGTVVRVERGTIVDKALATGQIVPREEIRVKSQISGIVRTCYVDVGDEVREGERLIEIAPNPTPLELTEAERNVQLAEIAYSRTELEHDRRASLLESGFISQGEYDAARKALEEVSVERDLAGERLALIKEGKIRGNRPIDSVIRAPAS
ncbi:MAG: efflux RND transporter periplasmic adaptor subunit, partial [Candidatus Eisenbacteria bacterium]